MLVCPSSPPQLSPQAIMRIMIKALGAVNWWVTHQLLQIVYTVVYRHKLILNGLAIKANTFHHPVMFQVKVKAHILLSLEMQSFIFHNVQITNNETIYCPSKSTLTENKHSYCMDFY